MPIIHREWMAAVQTGTPVGKCSAYYCNGNVYPITVDMPDGSSMVLPPERLPSSPDEPFPFLYEARCDTCKAVWSWPYGKDQVTSIRRQKAEEEAKRHQR